MSTTSGTKGNHDTVTTIFQNVGKADMRARKEKVSEFGSLFSDLVDKLDCQKIQTYIYNEATDKNYKKHPTHLNSCLQKIHHMKIIVEVI